MPPLGAAQAEQDEREDITNLTTPFFACAALVWLFAWASLSLCSA